MNRWKWIALAIAVLVVPLAAWQVVQLTRPDLHSFSVRHLSGAEAGDIIAGHVPAGAVEGWTERAVFVRVSDHDATTVAELLRREDVPKPQVALRFQVVEADGFTQTDTSIARIEGVLRNLFRFRGYRVVADAYLTTKEKSEASQTIIGADGVRYSIGVGVGEVLRREGKASAEIRSSLAVATEPILSTTVNVPDGQVVVLGTARPDAQRGALILVVTPAIR